MLGGLVCVCNGAQANVECYSVVPKITNAAPRCALPPQLALVHVMGSPDGIVVIPQSLPVS